MRIPQRLRSTETIPEPATELTLPMPWRRLRYNLECIGWTQGDLARRARIDESSVRQMCRGIRPIPDKMAMWTEELAAVHRAMWEPVNWAPRGRAAEVSVTPEFDPDDTETSPQTLAEKRELEEQFAERS